MPVIIDCPGTQVPIRDKVPGCQYGRMISENRIGRTKSTSLSVAQAEYGATLLISPNSPPSLNNQFPSINAAPYSIDWILVNWETYNAVHFFTGVDQVPPGGTLGTIREEDAFAHANFYRVVKEGFPSASLCSYRVWPYKRDSDPSTGLSASAFWGVYKQAMASTDAARFPGNRTSPALPDAVLVNGYVSNTYYGQHNAWVVELETNIVQSEFIEPDIPVIVITSPIMYGTGSATGPMPLSQWNLILDYLQDNGYGNMVWYGPGTEDIAKKYIRHAVRRAAQRRLMT